MKGEHHKITGASMSDMTHHDPTPDILARIEALEAEVRELRGHGHHAGLHGGLTTGPTPASEHFLRDSDGND